MSLSTGLFDVPPGKVAAVVTHLEMLARPPVRPVPPGAVAGLALRHVARPGPDWYRELFARIGMDWLWFSRLNLAPDALCAIVQDANVDVYALTRDGRDEGLLELDFRVAGECELTFFGVTAGLVGTGAARFLMNAAIACAWAGPVGPDAHAEPIRRFWLHTCSLDHPAALGFYMRTGFAAFRRQIEIADDPRLTGRLPLTAAPQVPILRA